MGKIVSIIGNKGGTGKTTLSHMVAHGLGLMDMRAVTMLTDTYRERLSKVGRTYLPFDARSPENLQSAVRRLRIVRDWMGVVDGGGNRPQVDEELAALSDLVILPFRESHEDIRTVMRDLERFPNAWALPSQWPTNPWAAASAQRNVDSLMAIHKDRILAPVFALSATKLLLQDLVPPKLPRALDNACREIAMQVLELLGIDIPDARWDAPALRADGAEAIAASAPAAGAFAPPVLHA